MSPTVNNFVHDLVAMAQAMETLPQVQAELEQTKIECQSLLDRIDRINADLEQSRTYAASLEQKVRTVEAERDDAEIRFLELDEKAHKVLAQMATVQAASDLVKDWLSPPKPQPEPVPQQDAGTSTTSQSSDVGQVADHGPVSEIVHSIEPDWKQDQAETSTMPPQVHSVTDPTTPTNPVTEPATSASSNDAKTSDVGSIAKLSGPYAGKRYFDVSGYVSHLDWLEGGGTEENYNWRPAY